MTKIRVLSDNLINKIAAGEIVERPASVVKELVENSLDAGAARIAVETEGSGKARLTVRDDGEGMNREDALLAFEHHATSKIRTDDDLAAIRTLGFRGEALPSIAAVSRLQLKTVAAPAGQPAEGAGTMVEIHGGRVREVREIPWAKGTEITIQDLFYNLPARKKFLKSDATESAHIARALTSYALANPEAHFSLRSNGRQVIDAPPVQSLTDRVVQIFGMDFLERMIPLDAATGTLRLHGLVSQPHQSRASTESQYLFVNRRMVRDRLLAGAVSQVYRGLLPSGAYPPVILFLEIPAEEVDVNVHPAKTEVRFRQAWPVQQFIRQAVLGALHASRPFASLVDAAAPPLGEPGLSPGLPGAGFPPGRPAAEPGRIRQIPLAYEFPAAEGSGEGAGPGAVAIDPAGIRLLSNAFPSACTGDLDRPSGGGWRVMGQWRDSFIVAASADELVIVDQHVAHERVLYESYLRQLSAGEVVRQRLLVPMTMDLNPAQMELLDQLRDRLQAGGFELEPFGPRSIVIKAVPALAGNGEADQLLRAILERIEENAADFSLDEIRRRVAAGLACHAAVKIHTPLTPARMQGLLDRLLEAEDPTTCPHGRPVVLRLPYRDLEKGFKR